MRTGEIGIVTLPISKAGLIPLSNLVKIFFSLSDKIHLVTGGAGLGFFARDGRVRTYGIRHKATRTLVSRMLNYILIQLRIAWNLFKLGRRVRLWVFFIGGEGLLLPILTAKLLNVKTLLLLAGFPTRGGQVREDPLSGVSDLLSRVSCSFTDRIVVYSRRVVTERRLERYEHKVSIGHEHYLDLDLYSVRKRFTDRSNTVGYVGRLSAAKGVLNFIHAIPAVLESEPETQFIIGGAGDLIDRIKAFVVGGRLSHSVKLLGWIPHRNLPEYLNELRLIVLPSYTEGLPNIMLEAMACGTPVLVTPVGAVPDIVEDGKTGFIMENNSPECIARNIARALNNPNLSRIAQNARALVESKFSYGMTLSRWHTILKSVLVPA